MVMRQVVDSMGYYYTPYHTTERFPTAAAAYADALRIMRARQGQKPTHHQPIADKKEFS
jgi:hypothetical protein